MDVYTGWALGGDMFIFADMSFMKILTESLYPLYRKGSETSLHWFKVNVQPRWLFNEFDILQIVDATPLYCVL